ncbi:MAG: bifunctional 2-methylcitrate synthase/citrate synthase [Actinobacteria bacterium]|nr:bifunctional 2-methylcitrate synthase/citrate synthase [Actinomycetota bacterium]
MGNEQLDVKRGLAGVVADTTAISMVNEQTNSLLYRGYPAQDLAVNCSFEEVAFLIWHGELPDTAELSAFVATERSRRSAPAGLLETLASLPLTCHPMDMLRTAISFLGAADPSEEDASIEANLARSLDMMAKIPTVVAADQRRRRGQPPIAPDPSLGFAENFFHMCFGSVPDARVVRCFEISLILYAEHGFNASTFTARVIASTLSDIYSATVGAIGALKGPLHGGANEAVMRMFEEIEDPDRAGAWLAEALASKRKIMGFGHRVYKNGDSRVPTMKAAFEEMAAIRGDNRLLALYDNLSLAMLKEKGIHPNLDYPTGPAYHLMCFDISTFTPIFVISRITGWTAHVMEQLSANSLIRPLSRYIGFEQRSVLAKRSNGGGVTELSS